MQSNAVDLDAWKSAEDQAKQVVQTSTQLKSESDAAASDFKLTEQIGQHLVGNVEGRLALAGVDVRGQRGVAQRSARRRQEGFGRPADHRAQGSLRHEHGMPVRRERLDVVRGDGQVASGREPSAGGRGHARSRRRRRASPAAGAATGGNSATYGHSATARAGGRHAATDGSSSAYGRCATDRGGRRPAAAGRRGHAARGHSGRGAERSGGGVRFPDRRRDRAGS